MKEGDIFEGFVTKYALTRGIIKTKLELCKWFDSDYYYVQAPKLDHSYFHGKEWHRTLEEAEDQARVMQMKKIASLKNQISKLENMKFDVK